MEQIPDYALQYYSKKYQIPTATLQQLFSDLKKEDRIWASFSQDWKYPQVGDSQKTAPMLDAAFHIERNKGVIIFLKYQDKK